MNAARSWHEAKATLRQYQERARGLAASLPAGPARQALIDICDFMVDRDA